MLGDHRRLYPSSSASFAEVIDSAMASRAVDPSRMETRSRMFNGTDKAEGSFGGRAVRPQNAVADIQSPEATVRADGSIPGQTVTVDAKRFSSKASGG